MVMALYGPIRLTEPANRVRVYSGQWTTVEVSPGWYDSIPDVIFAINEALAVLGLSCRVSLQMDTLQCPCPGALNAATWGARLVFHGLANEQFHGYAMETILGAGLLTSGSPAAQKAPVQTLVVDGVFQDTGMKAQASWFADRPEGSAQSLVSTQSLPCVQSIEQRGLRFGYLHPHHVQCLTALLEDSLSHERPWWLVESQGSDLTANRAERVAVRPDLNAMGTLNPILDRDLPADALLGAELILRPV